jgi:hypothetical protein
MGQKIGGMFFDEGQSLEEVEFTFDKFITEIVEEEERANAKKKEVIEESDNNKQIHKYTERAGNRIRYRRK